MFIHSSLCKLQRYLYYSERLSELFTWNSLKLWEQCLFTLLSNCKGIMLNYLLKFCILLLLKVTRRQIIPVPLYRCLAWIWIIKSQNTVTQHKLEVMWACLFGYAWYMMPRFVFVSSVHPSSSNIRSSSGIRGVTSMVKVQIKEVDKWDEVGWCSLRRKKV